jgi:DUF971 family protein
MSHEGIRFASPDEKTRDEEQNRPLHRLAVTPEKVRVLLTEGKGLEVVWKDGHESAWTFAWLRNACPCATCVEEREQQGLKPGQAKQKAAQLLPMYTPPPKPSSVLPVGRYALQFHWLDGHSSGIYSWDYLRRNCLCRECTFAAAKLGGPPN